MSENDKDNPIRNKSFDFSLRIINLYNTLTQKRNENVLSNQLLKSSTSIDANIEKGTAAFSKKEFIFKFQISDKEAFEIYYRIKLLYKTVLLIKKNLNF